MWSLVLKMNGFGINVINKRHTYSSVLSIRSHKDRLYVIIGNSHCINRI